MSMLKNINCPKHEKHPFHLVDPSPWPILTSTAVFTLVLGILSVFNEFKGSILLLFMELFFFCFCLARWFYDIVVEATFEGQHTSHVQGNILLGMQLFIVSEIMFFFSFFWAYFHFSLIPSIWTGYIWPIFDDVDPWGIPFANTVILLSSGVLGTVAHWFLKYGRGIMCYQFLRETIHLGVLFTGFQIYEYGSLPFFISSTAYGSIFYMITGFHGFHVLIGTIFLYVTLLRVKWNHFFTKYHIGFVCAMWYWHFVDVVWIALFWIVYVWGRYIDPNDSSIGEFGIYRFWDLLAFFIFLIVIFFWRNFFNLLYPNFFEFKDNNVNVNFWKPGYIRFIKKINND